MPAVTIEEVPIPAEAVRWSLPTRIAFRFFFVYFGIYCLPQVFDLLPFETAMAITEKQVAFWEAILKPVGKTLFGVSVVAGITGSGDMMFHYVQVFVIAVIAAVAALVWSILDRRRLAYPKLYGWFRSYIRFSLAIAMVGYGVVKVVKLQFGSLLLEHLMEPLGEASPMGLLWKFMSFSVLYNFFTGAGELLGAILLSTRRTALLGALVCIAVLSHVVVLNFSYDVPVKLYSMHLLFMAFIVAAPDWSRLANMFVLNRPVARAELRPRFERRWLDASSRVVRTMLVVLMVGFPLYQALATMREWQRTPLEKAPWYGVWNVDQLRVDGVERPPLVTDGTRLRRLIISSARVVTFQRMNDQRARYMMTRDERTRTLKLKPYRMAGSVDNTFSYTQPDPSTLVLSGTFDGTKMEATLHKAPLPEFVLTTRGFHWINEYPYNR